jgi:hypothetical protein
MGILHEISKEKDFANVRNILSQPGRVIKGRVRLCDVLVGHRYQNDEANLGIEI